MSREPHKDDPFLRATYQDQLVDCLSGVEISILERMLCPKAGLVSKLIHPPSIGEVNQWIEKARQPMLDRIGEQIDNIKRIEDSDKNVISEEERAVVSAKFDALAKDLGEKLKAKSEGVMGKIKSTQVHDPKALMASLNNLDDMRRGGG